MYLDVLYCIFCNTTHEPSMSTQHLLRRSTSLPRKNFFFPLKSRSTLLDFFLFFLHHLQTVKQSTPIHELHISAIISPVVSRRPLEVAFRKRIYWISFESAPATWQPWSHHLISLSFLEEERRVPSLPQSKTKPNQTTSSSRLRLSRNIAKS